MSCQVKQLIVYDHEKRNDFIRFRCPSGQVYRFLFSHIRRMPPLVCPSPSGGMPEPLLHPFAGPVGKSVAHAPFAERAVGFSFACVPDAFLAGGEGAVPAVVRCGAAAMPPFLWCGSLLMGAHGNVALRREIQNRNREMRRYDASPGRFLPASALRRRERKTLSVERQTYGEIVVDISFLELEFQEVPAVAGRKGPRTVSFL